MWINEYISGLLFGIFTCLSLGKVILSFLINIQDSCVSEKFTLQKLLEKRVFYGSIRHQQLNSSGV